MAEIVPGLVSVVIPVFNREQMLRQAVASVVEQRYEPVEIVLVDDGSTDDTGRTCDQLAAESPNSVRVVHQPNSGPGAAREAGRAVCRGEFIQYLDSDDLLLPRKLERQVEALRGDPEAGVAYGFTRYRGSDGRGRPEPWKGSGEPRRTMFPWFLTERWWDTPTPLYRRSVCDAAGPWRPLWNEEDWEYDCRIASKGTKLAHVKEWVAEVRDHATDRLSRAGARDRRRMASRTEAHVAVYGHALAAGIGPDSPFMKRYARELFLLSRQCGAAGLSAESRRLFELAREAAGPDAGSGADLTLYRFAAALVGWRMAGRLACWADEVRAFWTASRPDESAGSFPRHVECQRTTGREGRP